MSSVSASDTGWYVCGTSLENPESMAPMGFPIGMGLSLPGIFRARTFFPRRLQSRMIPPMISTINTRAFNAMTPRIAGRNLERLSSAVATSVDRLTDVVDPESETL